MGLPVVLAPLGVDTERGVAVMSAAVDPYRAAGVVAGSFVVDGEVTRVIEIHPYPQARTALGGCTSFVGRYVTDPAEVAAIRWRVAGGSR